MVNIAIITGARPNYMKVAGIVSLLRSVERFNVSHVHTNQHYDDKLSESILKQLKLIPDRVLDPDRSNSISRLSSISVELSRIFSELKTEIVVIPGDIDSSLAAAISALKCNVQIVHVESGLRSFDRKMPEEQNRIIIDELSSVLFITEFSGLRNIHPAPTQKLFYVGNTMIDSIISNNTEIERSNILIELNLQSFDYILCTFHRPSNVDDPEKLGNIFKKLSQINKNKTIIFPIHPRTLEILEKNPFLFELTKEIRVVPALNYFDFQKLLKNCFFVVTDSGGIQEEAAYYLKKCYTYRLNTERPATIFSGSNILILSDNWNEFINIYDEEIGEDLSVIDLWDGKSSYRIVEILKAIL